MKSLRNCRALCLLSVVVACAGAPPSVVFPLAPPLTQDPDRRPFSPMPEAYESPLLWDGGNHLLFRPIARLFAVDPGAEAANANALDEVADSSWFTNRIGQRPFSPADVASGPCTTQPLDPTQPWQVKSAKMEGATPGFIVKGPDGIKYMIKMDDVDQPPRPTAADAIGARLYYATGFTAPCNRVVFFDRSILHLAKGASAKTWTGEQVPLTEGFIDLILSHGTRLADGRYRVSSSVFLEGQPLGPWTYEGKRDGDPNDVVNHEDRRELRGARLLAAWLGHSDAREENTLSMWITDGKDAGWVRHAYIDFSDGFGAVWEPPALGRRVGFDYLFDIPAIAHSFVTLGMVQRPWEDQRFGPTGAVFGYYDIEHFDPEAWVTYYHNPAFARMTPRDAAWMARIIAHFTDAHLKAAIGTGRLSNAFLNQELLRILKGRQKILLRRYLAPLSSLSEPVVVNDGETTRLCVRDLAVLSGLREPGAAGYTAVLRQAGRAAAEQLPVGPANSANGQPGEQICAALPRVVTDAGAEVYIQVELASTGPHEGVMVVHLYQQDNAGGTIVGIERFER